MDAKAIANEFVKYYYSTFDASRANLAPLYVTADLVIDAQNTPTYAQCIL
jgi:hypothetical protein